MNITLYSKPGCPQCKVLKMKLDAANVEYKLIEDLDAMIAMGATGAPVLLVEGSMYCGPNAIKWFNNWIKERNNGN